MPNRAIELPPDPGKSGWQAILPGRDPHPALDSDIRTGVLVIGAGFAGLSAARRLKQLDRSLNVTLIEGAEIASGPAGRNSGFMIDLPHDLSSSDYHSGNSVLEDVRQTTMNRAAIAFAVDAARQYGMPVDALAMSGKINAAASAKGDRHNQSYAKHLEALGEQHELLDAIAMQSMTGINYYLSGLYTPGTALLQPALYIRCLADGLVEDGVEIFENSPVTGLTRENGSWRAKTPNGEVRSDAVVLAVNGLLENFGYYRNRLMHVFTYASMTRPLTGNEALNLGGRDEWAFTPADAMGTTVRKIVTGEGPRIVIRNRFTYDGNASVPATRIGNVGTDHDRAFRNRFPMLDDVGMDYRWGGRLCLSLNGVGAIAELAPGLHSACCQNGLGTAKGTLAGIVAAEQLLGSRESLVPEYAAEPLPYRLPPKALMNLGANAYLRFKEKAAGPDF